MAEWAGTSEVVRGGWGMEGVGVGVAGGGMYSSKA